MHVNQVAWTMYLVSAGLLALLFFAGCDSAGSKATGPTLNCILTENDSTGAKGASATVGDTTQVCGPNRTQDSHDVLPTETP